MQGSHGEFCKTTAPIKVEPVICFDAIAATVICFDHMGYQAIAATVICFGARMNRFISHVSTKPGDLCYGIHYIGIKVVQEKQKGGSNRTHAGDIR